MAISASEWLQWAIAFGVYPPDVSNGSVTQVGTGTGLTGGPITSSGNISFAPIAANSFWANVTGGIAVPTVQSLSSILAGAVLLSPSGDQTITSNNLTLAAGTFTIGAQTGGVNGQIILYPNAASVGGFRILNNVVSSFSTTISNSSVAQAQAISIPDAGATTANFLLSKSSTVQHITAGGLQADAGIMGSGKTTGGTAGQFIAYSPTTTLGSLSVTAADNAGNFANVLTNTSTAAARTWTLPDATGTIALTTSTVAVATTVTTTATNSTNASFFLAFVASGTSGNQGVDTATGLTFNPSTNTLTTTIFSGALSGNATSATNVSVGGITGLGTGVATALAINVGSAGAPVLFNGAGGTPSSVTLTNATGLPIGGTTGYGTGVATALAANVTGSGGIVLATSPTLVTPIIGVASATSINFGGTALSIYTEGTFTPTFTCSSPGDLSVVYTNQSGVYTRIGRMVFYTFRLSFTPTFTTASGQAQFAGLPFACVGAGGVGCGGSLVNISGSITWPAGATSISSFVDNGATYSAISTYGSAVNSSSVQMSGLVSGTPYLICITGAYNA